MQVVHMKCPSCGNSLEVEDGLETFFCQYCGHRIVLADQSEYVIKAKVDIEKLKHEERILQMKIEAERREREEDDRESRFITFVFIGIGAAFAIGGLIAWLIGAI